MFAARLKELRKEKGITQVEFAKIFDVAGGTIAMWETGKRQPDIGTLYKLADFFDVSVDYLLGRSDKKKPLALGDGTHDITFDDFTYALDGEIRSLNCEDKQKLLEMAQLFKMRLEKEKEEQGQ